MQAVQPSLGTLKWPRAGEEYAQVRRGEDDACRIPYNCAASSHHVRSR